jgi:hypothetical protein
MDTLLVAVKIWKMFEICWLILIQVIDSLIEDKSSDFYIKNYVIKPPIGNFCLHCAIYHYFLIKMEIRLGD